MILLTTPDYLPRLGGLTSHTINIEKVLKKIGLSYELFHWKNYQEIISFPAEKLKKYDAVLNIHSGFHMFMPVSHPKVINFLNGAEILFYSPNPIKNLLKKMTASRSLRRVEEAYCNIFISEFTFNTLTSKGLKPDYSRDIIFHMVVDTSGHKHFMKSWDDNIIRFIKVARDVPHKNFQGAIRFCELVQEKTGKKIEFVTVTNKEFHSDKIKIISHINPDNSKRDELLASSHINLLLSLDHSHRGFFEGFGQIVQEAGCFATPSVVLKTGGLPESVHDQFTGWVLSDLTENNIDHWVKAMSPYSYRSIADQSYTHTIESHGLSGWEKLFSTLLLQEKNLK